MVGSLNKGTTKLVMDSFSTSIQDDFNIIHLLNNNLIVA
jgi:hypothetical protein